MTDLIAHPRKIGIIIGNNNYEELGILRTCERDVSLMETTLKKLGFITHVYRNLTNGDLKIKLDEFYKYLIKEGDIVFFYFSGHGGQQTRNNQIQNYLFGIDAKKDEKGNVKGVHWKYKVLQAFFRKCVYIVVLDTCRKYPKQCYFLESSGWDLLQGVTDSNQECDLLFACQPGYFAIENQESEYGNVAKALSACMENAKTWDEAYRQTIRQVMNATHGLQKPQILCNVSQTLNIKSDLEYKYYYKFGVKDDFFENSQPLPKITLQEFIKKITKQPTFRGGQVKIGRGWVEVGDDFPQNIEINLEKSPKEICVQNFRLSTNTPKTISFKLCSDQTIHFTKCIFENIGLEFRGGNYENKQGQIYLEKISITNPPFSSQGAIKFYCLIQACLKNTKIQNCQNDGCVFNLVDNVKVQRTTVLQCNHSGIKCLNVDSFNASEIDVYKCEYGFYFDCSRAFLDACNIIQCKYEVFTENNQIDLSNICKYI